MLHIVLDIILMYFREKQVSRKKPTFGLFVLVFYFIEFLFYVISAFLFNFYFNLFNILIILYLYLFI